MKKLFKFQVKVFAIVAILLVSISGVFAQQKIAIIDAGSSGSRLYVYDVQKNGKLVKVLSDKKINWPLSKVCAQKDSVRRYVDTMTKLYSDTTSSINLYVLATAGMRYETKGKADSIYRYIMAIDKINNYKIKNAMTISGRYEGFCAWIAANYEHGNLGFSTSTPQKPLTYTGGTYGIIEIGGASMQIAFASDHPSTETISRKGFSNIYCKSYLGGGLNEFNKPRKDGRTNEGDVISGLETINKLKAIDKSCENIEFFGIGWAFDGLMKSSDTENKDKREYVTRIYKTLGLKKSPTVIGSTWTKGAALDIAVNGESPEEFNYDMTKPN